MPTKKVKLICKHIVKKDRNKKGKGSTYYCPNCCGYKEVDFNDRTIEI